MAMLVLQIESLSRRPDKQIDAERMMEPSWLSRCNLQSRNLIQLGKSGQAICLLEKVVAAKKATMRLHHKALSNQVASQYAPDGAFRSDGQVERAVTLLGDVVEIQEQLGPSLGTHALHVDSQS